MRPEQEDAVNRTMAYYKSAYEENSGRTPKFLWNAKMRFGKTLCALEVARLCGYRRTLILTHRPNVRGEWFESLLKLKLDGWLFGCKDPNAVAFDAQTHIANNTEERLAPARQAWDALKS